MHAFPGIIGDVQCIHTMHTRIAESFPGAEVLFKSLLARVKGVTIHFSTSTYIFSGTKLHSTPFSRTVFSALS